MDNNSPEKPQKNRRFVDELVEDDQQKPAFGIYILPNLFTTAALFGGFYAIVASIRGLFEIAAIALFIAMIADSLDGRVARLTNTQSAFGAEYDSLSDLVAFGVAPALMVYEWSLQYLGKIGWLGSFVFVAAVALRLARFNSQQGNLDKRYFTGLPCPAAAAIIAALVWVGATMRAGNLLPSIGIEILTVAVALAMISNFKYRSFKDFDIKNRVPFISLLFVILVFVCIALKPDMFLFLVFFSYGASGLVTWLREKNKPTENSTE